MSTANDKRHDFLWMVQSFMLRDQDVLGWSGHLGDAVAASYLIPSGCTARDAALDFWAFCNPDFRGGGEAKCPSWMRNLKDPIYRD